MTISESQALTIATICSSSLSCLGSLFIIWTFIIIPNIRKILTFRLILYLTISDFILTISGLVGAVPLTNSTLCYIIAAFIEYGRISSLIWSFILSKVIYDAVTTQVLRTDHECKYIVIAYGLPLIFSIPPIFIGWFGSGGAYCWVKSGLPVSTGILADTVEFYGIWFIGVIVMAYYFRKMGIIVNKSIEKANEGDKTFNLLYYYPWILMLCWILPCIDRYYITIFDGDYLPLRVANVVGGQIQGFLNSLIYITNSSIRLSLKNYFKKRQLGQKQDSMISVDDNESKSNLEFREYQSQ